MIKHPFKGKRLRRAAWLILALACLGASWFTYQCLLVSQPTTFAPDWAGAQWIQAADNAGPVAYFRYTTTINVLPDGAFVTVSASQVFRLYVNGIFVGSNASDFARGNYPRAYIFDINSLLASGPDVIALRVSNIDTHAPLLRATLGIIQGQTIAYHVTGNNWLATTQSTLVYAHDSSSPKAVNSWTTASFDASSWQAVRYAGKQSPTVAPMLTVNPALYERAANTQWISAGAGNDAYFVRQFSVPLFYTGAWLRLAASGTASVFLNGHLLISWNGQIIVSEQNVSDYLSVDQAVKSYRSGLAMGIYNITPYLHAGTNTIAVHVSAPGTGSAMVGLNTLDAAMSADVLISDMRGDAIWLTPNVGWRASLHAVAGWDSGSSTALAWSSSLQIGRPGALRAFYLQDTLTSRSQQFLPFSLLAADVILSFAIVIGVWLLVGLFIMRRMRRFFTTRRAALEAAALIFLPALALEALLLTLSRESLIPQPFPYTWQWGIILLGVVITGYMLVWRGAVVCLDQGGGRNAETLVKASKKKNQGTGIRDRGLIHTTSIRIGAFLREHWLLVVIFLIALPMISYNLAYEPYWQDELTSYYAAKGVLAHGFPTLSSGFIYPKGELYSYLLALSMLIFGDHGAGPRILSVLEYLACIPLFYAIACYFFEKRIALLATAMLAFSPITLLWGRETRMYEQAQLCTLLTAYLFYRALDMHECMSLARRRRFIYLAMLGVVVTYLSHEETFIIFPALLCFALLTWFAQRRRATTRVAPTDADARAAADNMRKHWIIATVLVVSIIGSQLLIVHFTHPPMLGTDQSQRPLISLTANNIMYYFDLMFDPVALGRSTLPWIMLNSVLAVLGSILAVRDGHKTASYCALFLGLAFFTLMFTFTLTSDRYIYPVLPFYYLLDAYALFRILRGLWSFARSHLASPGQMTTGTPLPSTAASTAGRLALPVRALLTWVAFVLCAATLILPALPISSYNLFVSRAVGLDYHRHYPDYDAVGAYVRQHWQKGDIVIAVSPAISILYYVGHVDYFFSLDRALYLFESDGHIIDTPTGSVALLDQQDFMAEIAGHTHVWIISDNATYQSSTVKRFTFPSDFHIVYEGYGSAVYFRNG